MGTCSTRPLWMEHWGELQGGRSGSSSGKLLRKALVPEGRSWWKVTGGGTQLAAGGWLPPLFGSGTFPTPWERSVHELHWEQQ